MRGEIDMTVLKDPMVVVGIVLIGGLLVQQTAGVEEVLIMVALAAQSMTSTTVHMKGAGAPSMIDTAGRGLVTFFFPLVNFW